MSTTTSQVYNEIALRASQEEALGELSPSPDTVDQLRADINSGSTVSVWRLFAWLFAYASKLQQDLFDRYRVDVLALAKDGHYGSLRWFAAKARAFQFGHSLVMTALDGVYAVDDPAARIISQVAVVEAGNRVIVKVAKTAGTGLAKLDPPEALAVNDYFQTLRPPVLVTVLTADADKLRVSGTVVYDAEASLAAVQAVVTLAVSTYLTQLAFGGLFRETDLRLAMLAVPGVVDVRLTLLEARSLGDFIALGRTYYSYAGHMQVDAAFPLTSSMAWAAGYL